jgi:hypothetical protein
VARQRADELELSENELVVARDELDQLKDQIYVLACAVLDVQNDLAKGPRQTIDSLRESIDWLIEAAIPVTGSMIGTRDTSQ